MSELAGIVLTTAAAGDARANSLVTLAAEELLCRLVDVLEQEDLDLVLRQGGFHSRGR